MSGFPSALSQTEIMNHSASATLRPLKEDILGIVVESTYNWYWLVDLLMEEGYRVHLANPSRVAFDLVPTNSKAFLKMKNEINEKGAAGCKPLILLASPARFELALPP